MVHATVLRASNRKLALALAITSGFFLLTPARAVDVWDDLSGDNFWNTTSSNWLVNGVQGHFTQNDAVVFNDASGPAHYAVIINGAVNPASVTVNNSAGSYVFTGSGTIGIGSTPSLTKLGSGPLLLSMTTSNNFSAGTTIYQGAVLLDFSNMVNPVDPIKSSSSLTMAGGALVISGKGGATSSQTFSSTTFGSGGSFLQITPTETGSASLNLNGVSRSIGATINFLIPFGGSSMTTTNSNTNSILGGYATVNSNDWAVSGGNGVTAGAITALSVYSNDSLGSGLNSNITLSAAYAADVTTNSLRYNTAANLTSTFADTSNNVNMIQSGGILMTSNVGAHNNLITGGTLTSGAADLIVIQNDSLGALTVASQIVNNGVSVVGLTISGSGVANITGSNIFTGITTINNAVLATNSLVNEGAAGGTASGIGQSGNAAGNLILNQGTLRYIGSGGSTDRLLTLGPGGGTIDSSGTGKIDFNGNGVALANAIAFSQDTAATFTLTGNFSTAANTFAPIISDPDATHTYATSVIKAGTGTWILTNANTYSGPTTINAGALKINNTSGSGTGSGPVTVNSGGSIGGSGTISGLLTINAGGHLNPGDPVTFNTGNLTLNSGSLLDYTLSQAGIFGPAGGNDATNVAGTLTISTNVTVNVNAVGSFSTGTYPLIHYNTNTDNSSGFQGWLPAVSWAAAPANTYYSFSNVNSNINLIVQNSGGNPITLPPGAPPIGIPLPIVPGGPGNPVGNGGNPIILNANANNPVRVGPFNNPNAQNLGAGFINAPNGRQNILNVNNNIVNNNGIVLAPVLNLIIAPKIQGQFVGFAYPVDWPTVTLPVTFPGANAAAAIANANNTIQNNWMTTDSVGVMNLTPLGLVPSVYFDIIPAGWGTESLRQSAALSPFANANGSDPLNPRVPDPINTSFGAYLAGLPAGTLWIDIDGGWGAQALAAAPDPNNAGQWFISADMWAILDYDVQVAPVAPNAVPEPAALSALALGAGALLLRRRKR
ncbi:MAG TPA: autotransporter-associated beta strand repeat-containing protein [Phycisphaerae bacterium]